MFFVECKADLTLVRALSNAPANRIMHAGNKSGVLGKLIRARGRPNYQNSIGMIDQDPWSSQSSSLKRFKEMECCNDLASKYSIIDGLTTMWWCCVQGLKSGSWKLRMKQEWIWLTTACQLTLTRCMKSSTSTLRSLRTFWQNSR